jgi:hypothetical protein
MPSQRPDASVPPLVARIIAFTQDHWALINVLVGLLFGGSESDSTGPESDSTLGS